MPSKDNLWLTPRIKTVSSGKWASKAHPEAKALRCLPSCPPCPPPLRNTPAALRPEQTYPTP